MTFNISQNLTYFGYHGSSASGAIIRLVCHVISWDHLIEGSCEFMAGSTWHYFTTLISLMTIGIAIVEMKCFCLLKDFT